MASLYSGFGVTLVTRTAIALPFVLLLLSCGAESRALLGLFDLLASAGNEFANGTSILGALAAAHAQHTINKLENLIGLLTLAQNTTATALG